MPVLHTCGSTILMGKSCGFTDTIFTTESLAAGWGKCLTVLERYTRLSSVARKSYCILNQSARRLEPLQHGPVRDAQGLKPWGQTDEPGTNQQPVGHRGYEQQPIVPRIESTGAHTPAIVHSNSGPMRPLFEPGIQQPTEPTRGLTPELLPFVDSDLQMGNLEELDDNFWLGDSGTFNWSLMPSLPQSRALSPGFGASDPTYSSLGLGDG